jgi:quercetin dioxygenase-like cupin family protein
LKSKHKEVSDIDDRERIGKSEKNQRWAFGSEIESFSPDPGVSRKVLAYCDEMMCVENRFEIGAIGPIHNHPHTQITYVAKGRFRFTIAGETREVGPGDALLKKGGVLHGCLCLEEGVLVDVFSPSREDFLSSN